MVMFAIYRNRSGRMRTITNSFLFNLSCMDLLRVVVCMPTSVAWDVTDNWFLGTAMCKIIAFVEKFSIYVSILTLSYIAHDRWHSLENPFRTSSTASTSGSPFMQKPTFIIICMWAVAAILALPEPIMLTTKTTTIQNRPESEEPSIITTCAMRWSKETDAFYTIAKAVLSFGFPLVFMFVLYTKVFGHMVRRGRKTASTPAPFSCISSASSRLNQQQQPMPIRNLNRRWRHRFKHRIQTLKMLAAMARNSSCSS